MDTCSGARDISAMSMPAARINDMHLCPMQTPAVVPVPHVGGPIVGPGIPTVLVEGIPASVVGDICTCVGPPDAIVAGSPTVFISGRMAARVGDSTAHGGAIAMGAATVLIGDMGGGAGTPAGATMKSARNEGKAFTQMSCAAKTANSGAAGGNAARTSAGGAPAAPAGSNAPSDPTRKKTWVEIELLDDNGKPVKHERYRIVTPDAQKHEGFLDDKGLARVDDIDPGTCVISFPDLDGQSWKPA